MSLTLEKAKISVKTWPVQVDGGEIRFGGHEVPMDEFCHAVMYVLTNTNLTENDPRKEFIMDVQRLVLLGGFGDLGFQLGFPE